MTAGWEALNAAMAKASAEIAAAAPDAAVAAEGEAYLVRVMTSCLADGFLGHLFTEGGLASPLPTRGGPNPDYLMSHAMIDPARRYRLEGNLHESERIGVGLYSFRADGAVLLAGYAAFDRGSAAADGTFSLDLAAGAEGSGALAIPSDCRVLIVRILHRSPTGRPGSVALTGGGQRPGLSVATGNSDGSLIQAGQILLNSVLQFLEWSKTTSSHPNQFISPPANLAATVQGDPDTTYYLGYYMLGENEWLQVLMPQGLDGYWSLYAYNHWCEMLPGAGIHDLSAVPDADNQIRVNIGPAVPTHAPNRIDTLGRQRGVLIFRAIGTADLTLPRTAVIARS